jgi:hypothetical protein
MPISSVAGVGIAAGLAIAWRLGWVWWKNRGQRVVTCPENGRHAGVVVAAPGIVQSLVSKPTLRLSECSRWPEKAGCGQQCLSEVREAGSECLVRTIIGEWYRGKKCAVCAQTIGDIDWTGGSRPAVLGSGQQSIEWTEIPADKLIETLDGALPICFACHTANRLVREHPELVVVRNRAGV